MKPFDPSFFDRNEDGYSMADLILAFNKAWNEALPSEYADCAEESLDKSLWAVCQGLENAVDIIYFDNQKAELPTKGDEESLNRWYAFLEKTFPKVESVDWYTKDKNWSQSKEYTRYNKDIWLRTCAYGIPFVVRPKDTAPLHLGLQQRVAKSLGVKVTPKFLARYQKAKDIIFN